MDPEFKYPRWQRLLEAAILEFDPVQLCVRLQEVEVAISTRLQELTSQKGGQDEDRALRKAILTMRILEKNRRVFRQSLS
jgi:hypothetical protein